METLQLKSLVEEQYYKADLFEDIISRLKNKGVDLNNVSRKDIAGVDEFHVRGAEVSKELVNGVNINKLKVLDIGCGIGGPSRMLADDYDCSVTGIDLCGEYIRTAQKLSELVGLQDKTNFIQANALGLPFDNESFDIVWTQHVQMNIEDKEKFYSEIKRVLMPNGIIMYYDIFKQNSGNINYPVPWANEVAVSFLTETSTMDSILINLGFNKLQTVNQTAKASEFLKKLFENLKKNGPPQLGLNVLMGASTKEKLGNIFKGIQNNKLTLQSGIYKKQA